MKKALQIIGMTIGIISMVLAVVWFDWHLAVVILLALWGNNLERRNA